MHLEGYNACRSSLLRSCRLDIAKDFCLQVYSNFDI